MATKSDTVLLGDRYEVLAPIGSGTAATVYKVRDRRTGVLRAAKLLAPDNAANPKVLARFEDEFRILRTLHHPHLAEVYDYGWTPEGGRYLIMELVDGVPLDQFFRENPSDIWAILYELCETLTFVHNHKLLHQDIKPSNILVKRTTAYGPDLPLVKLIDFGLMYRRDTGTEVELVGTPEYMAPEVARGDSNLTRAVDYYSLGATLFELLVGRPPFVGRASEVLRAHLEREPVIEEEELEWAELYPHVRALLSKDWRSRLEAFEEFRRAVANRLTGGIEELDRAYGLAKASKEQAEKGQEWDHIETWLDGIGKTGNESALEVRGTRGAARDHLLGSLAAECRIRGFNVVRLIGDASDVLQIDEPSTRQVDRFNKSLTRMNELSRPVVLVIDGIEHVGEDAAGFIRYLSTRRELAGNRGARFAFVLARRLRSDNELDPYFPSDRRFIELADSADSDLQSATDDLRSSVLASAVFRGKRSSERQRLLAYVAAHPVAVPISWVREFVGSSVTRFTEDLETLATVHLISKVVAGGLEAVTMADDARAAARDVIPADIQAESHRDLAARVSLEVESACHRRSSVYSHVAFHYAAIGETRSALVSHIRAVKAAWREGSIATVKSVAQSGLEYLDGLEDEDATASRRYFVTQWVNALWKHNQHTRAKRVIDLYIVNRGGAVPPSLLPKYIRGILDAKEPATAFAFMKHIDVDSLSRRVAQQVSLEHALLVHQNAQHEASLEILGDLGVGQWLNTKDRFRVPIYKAMCLSDLGAHEDVERLLLGASKAALVSGCTDEFVLMSAIRAQSRTLQGNPRRALQIISQALRVAHRNEHYLRLNALYRLAASAYRDLGQPSRAARVQQRALALAGALGNPSLEAMSWSRLADYSRLAGHMGDALRYIRKAEAVIGDSTYETERAQLKLADLSIHGWLMSPQLEKKINEAQWIAETRGVNERGRYFLHMGNYCADRHNWTDAQRYYEKAQVSLVKAGLTDNMIMLARARLRAALCAGEWKAAQRQFNSLQSERLRYADSTHGQLERNLALLEFAFEKRSGWKVLKSLLGRCLSQANEGVEARLRLDALSLSFRVLARQNRVVEAEAVFQEFLRTLKVTSSNLDESYVSGVLDRLSVSQLALEYESLRKRDKAGTSPALSGSTAV